MSLEVADVVAEGLFILLTSTQLLLNIFVHSCRRFEPFQFSFKLLLPLFDLLNFHTCREHQPLKALNTSLSFADVEIRSAPPIEIGKFSSKRGRKRLNALWGIVSSGEDRIGWDVRKDILPLVIYDGNNLPQALYPSSL